MRSILFGWLLLTFSASGWGNEEVNVFVKELKEEDRVLLDRFLRLMVQTVNGFVIYGDKPLGLVSYVNDTVLLPSDHKNANVFPKGKDLWLGLNVSPYDKEYSFAVFNCNGYCNFVAINRKAFIKAVNDNLPLFRYVLGPTLTAEELLKELLDAKDDFYGVFKNDNVLFGILLGYGTQNALLVSRSEFLCCSQVNNQKEVFPYLPYLIREHKKGVFKNQAQCPSLKYSTIAEEIKDLEQRTDFSHHSPPLVPYALPYFGCEINSKETQILIAAYKKNQEEILAAVQDPNFLERTLTKFLTTTSGKVEVPPIPIQTEPLFVETKEDFSDKLADLLAMDVAYQERRSKDLCLKSYLEGMEFQKKNGKMPIKPDGYDQNWRECHELEEKLARSQSLQQANDYFTRLAQSEKLVCLIPNGIYYKVLKKGRGKALSSKINKVSFHYSFRVQGRKCPHSIGTIEEENPGFFIPGLIHTLIGMKRGEERWVAIHPKYGYGDCSFLSPNSTLIVKIQLLDFEEGDQEIAISPPYELKMNNIEEMQARFDELKAKRYYEKGRQLWHVLTQTGEPIDLRVLKKASEGILTGERVCPFKTVQEAHDYSVHLREYLLSKKQAGISALSKEKSS